MNHQSAANETHPLLENYVERQIEREANTASEGTSEVTFLRWTTCDEIKRCSCAILSFVLMAALVGSGLVLFWFLWAWFVLYLDLPGVLTPIVWLAGFLLPLCGFKLLQSCPRCTRACLAQPLIPPDINAWKTHHLWNQRRQFIVKIHKVTPLPMSLAEMVSDFCFHCDVLVTTNKNKLVGIYPDTARLHTVAEFSKSITDLAVANGNIHRVYVLMCREMQKTALDCRDRLGCDGGDEGDDQDEVTANAAINNRNPAGNTWTSIPSWIWEPKQHVDMMICEYDIAGGSLTSTSPMFSFEQISVTTMQQLRGIYYKPSYRLMVDGSRDLLVVSRDGDFCVFDTAGLGLVARREIIGHPENRDDREQFVHLREYRFTASRLVPQGVVQWVLGIVDQVEGTQSGYLLNENDVYVMVPFGQHALFICNVSTGWLRYLDFSHVDPISDSAIHYLEFSVDGQYLYLCCTQKLSVLSTVNFQPIITVPFTKLDHVMPCGLIRTPPTEQQILLMLHKHRQALLKTAKLRHSNSINSEFGGMAGARSLGHSNRSLSALPQMKAAKSLSEDPRFLEAVKESLSSYKLQLSKKLESIAVVFASTRIFMDPRIFLYRFPDNKSRVVSHGNGKQRSVYSGGSFLIDRVTNEAPSQGVGQQWHYISMKQQKPWNHYKRCLNLSSATTSGDTDLPRKQEKDAEDGLDGGDGNLIGDSNFVPILNRI